MLDAELVILALLFFLGFWGLVGFFGGLEPGREAAKPSLVGGER